MQGEVTTGIERRKHMECTGLGKNHNAKDAFCRICGQPLRATTYRIVVEKPLSDGQAGYEECGTLVVVCSGAGTQHVIASGNKLLDTIQRCPGCQDTLPAFWISRPPRRQLGEPCAALMLSAIGAGLFFLPRWQPSACSCPIYGACQLDKPACRQTGRATTIKAPTNLGRYLPRKVFNWLHNNR